VHEAYLKLVDQRDANWETRLQFFAVAAQLMCRILVDYARRHRASKRGGDVYKLSLDEAPLPSEEKDGGLLALDEALDRLAAIVAVLFYDKRGVNASTGTRTESIADLATDALASVEWLKTREEINPKKIGLHGHSQGGWVVPEAASRSKDVAFIIAGAASGWDTFKNGEYEVRSNAADANLSQSEMEQALALYKLGNRVLLANGVGWNDWRAAVIKSKDEKWFRFARSSSSLSEMNDANRERIMAFVNRERRTFYDPVPAWEKITIPVLVYEGEWDRDVPAKESVTIIDTALKKGGNKNYTIKLFPKAQHGLWAVERDNRFEPLVYRVHHQVLFKWLLNQVMGK
jgi:pimeloyl-ACP methyl ester carboxylesterase